jgi:hypothetical protein
MHILMTTPKMYSITGNPLGFLTYPMIKKPSTLIPCMSTLKISKSYSSYLKLKTGSQAKCDSK